MHGFTAILMLIYILMVQRRRTLPSLAAAVATWVLLGLAARQFEWSFPYAALLSLITYPTCLWFARPYRDAPMPAARRRWFDIPARVAFVCTLMGTLLVVSTWAGPVTTGFIAMFPVSLLSAILILHSRIGDRATAAMVASGLRGNTGIALALAALHLTVVPFGPAVALALLVAIPMAWNLLAWVQGARRAPARP
jgi:hypothetical protein